MGLGLFGSRRGSGPAGNANPAETNVPGHTDWAELGKEELDEAYWEHARRANLEVVNWALEQDRDTFVETVSLYEYDTARELQGVLLDYLDYEGTDGPEPETVIIAAAAITRRDGRQSFIRSNAGQFDRMPEGVMSIFLRNVPEDIRTACVADMAARRCSKSEIHTHASDYARFLENIRLDSDETRAAVMPHFAQHPDATPAELVKFTRDMDDADHVLATAAEKFTAARQDAIPEEAEYILRAINDERIRTQARIEVVENIAEHENGPLHAASMLREFPYEEARSEAFKRVVEKIISGYTGLRIQHGRLAEDCQASLADFLTALPGSTRENYEHAREVTDRAYRGQYDYTDQGLRRFQASVAPPLPEGLIQSAQSAARLAKNNG